MKVCAEVIPAGMKWPAVPTHGYRRRPPAADLLDIGPVERVYPPAAPSAAAMPQCGEKCGLEPV